MKNLGLRIVALFLALILWFVVSAPRREPVRERTFRAPVSLVGVPRDYVITTPVPETVDVRLRGRISDLRAVSSQNLEVPIDLSWVAQPGEVTITLRPQAINVPPDVEVFSIEPNKFRFRVEELRQRAVPIRPFLVGAAPIGYNTGDPTVQPDRALVSGPASQILKLSEVATERIIMTGRTETFTTSVAVVSDSPLVRVISPIQAQVTVPVLAEFGPNPPAATDTTDSSATTGTSTTTTTTSEQERKDQ
ncbi:MAG TPA: CdaR family protein [Thermoanaerobaculia bacterium]|jgi:YbbR domain-containing protein